MGARDPIRVWSAGCASGEEVYTIAMLLAQALGREQFGERVKIYGTQLSRLNAILESIFTSLRGGVVMLDRDLHVQKWNRKAEDLWGLRPEEAQSKNFLNLDIGLPVDLLKAPIRACPASDSDREFMEVVLDATNRRGKPMRVKVICTQLANPNGGDPQGVILLMEETDARM